LGTGAFLAPLVRLRPKNVLSQVKNMISVDEFLAEWQWARQLSVSLLGALPDSALTAQPISSAGPWWKQFRHLARVQENYLQAFQTGRIEFTPEHSTYSEGPKRQALSSYLEQTDRKLFEILRSASVPDKIDWFGTPTTLQLHLARLLSHETLHHGQFIVYSRHTGVKLPKCWDAWGEGENK
jgi:uncharacterized damage-inducible protein DinB